jgi:hypothetical protein
LAILRSAVSILVETRWCGERLCTIWRLPIHLQIKPCPACQEVPEESPGRRTDKRIG